VRTGPLYVIATGGLSGLVYRESSSIDEVEKFIAINGLKILYEKNKDHHKFK
jgi:type III pantothenate kinase